jgi:hypothetical protein
VTFYPVAASWELEKWRENNVFMLRRRRRRRIELGVTWNNRNGTIHT